MIDGARLNDEAVRNAKRLSLPDSELLQLASIGFLLVSQDKPSTLVSLNLGLPHPTAPWPEFGHECLCTNVGYQSEKLRRISA